MNFKRVACSAMALLMGSIWAAGVRPVAEANEAEFVKDTQPETIALTSPQDAAVSFEVPDGFSVSLFAAEPQVHQPIGMTTDTRGRLWVAENFTYAEQPTNFDTSQRDRIRILEDSDHDGVADRSLATPS